MGKTQPTYNFSKHTTKDCSRKYFINNFNKTLVKTIKHLKVETVLDAGCGEGFTLNELAKNNIGEKLEGIDGSKEAILLGKKTFPKLNIKTGSIYKLPYKNNSIDLVLCTEVLEHLKEPGKALKELKRVSKKYLILSVPNEPFYMFSRLLRGMNILRLGNHPEHLNFWTFLSFKKFVEKEGLKIRKLSLPFPWTIILAEKN